MKFQEVIVWGFWAGNVGDDLFLCALTSRYPSVNFHIVCDQRFSLAFNKIKNIYIHESVDATVLNCSLQIFLGGSIFMEPSDAKKILPKVLCTTKYNISNIPYIIIGANFGPFTKYLFYRLYYEWFKNAEDICFRDRYSKNLFSKLNNVRWAPDILLGKIKGLEGFHPVSKSISISLIQNNQRIGLPNYNEDNYISAMKNIIKIYIELGFNIKLLSFCPYQGDTIICNQLYNYLSNYEKKKTCLIEYNGSNLLEFLKNGFDCQYMIGTRFHSIILSWALNIKSMPIIYNQKMEKAILDYSYPYKYAYLTDLKNISFKDIDYNRNLNYWNCIELSEKSAFHFAYTDKILGGTYE